MRRSVRGSVTGEVEGREVERGSGVGGETQFLGGSLPWAR